MVLGGLIADEYSQRQERVPLLGDIPLLGNLFNTSRERKKTNLMVFLRPTVLRDANSSSQISQDRYESIRGMQQTVQPDPNLLMRKSMPRPCCLPPAVQHAARPMWSSARRASPRSSSRAPASPRCRPARDRDASCDARQPCLRAPVSEGHACAIHCPMALPAAASC
jgi:hypothetical protein